jgi:hypothetical protein
MAEWIGHFIANWPVWLVVATLLIISIVWIVCYVANADAEFPWKKKEWWQDRYRRLEKEAKAKQAKKG